MEVKKSAFYSWNQVVQFDNNSIKVYTVVQSTSAEGSLAKGILEGDHLELLRKAAIAAGLADAKNWNKQTIRKHILDAFGKEYQAKYGKIKAAYVGDYLVDEDLYVAAPNTAAKMRELAGRVGMEVDPKWNTQQLGSKLIDFIKQKD